MSNRRRAGANTGVVVWFRQDLRLHDHPALMAAAQSGEPVWPVFVWSPEAHQPWTPGAASRWWLHHSLTAVACSLRERYGRSLTILRGDPAEQLAVFAKRVGARAVYFTRAYEPAASVTETALAETLIAEGREVRRFPGALLFEPEDIQTVSGGPFKVFTAFWKACAKQPPSLNLLSPPVTLPGRDEPGIGLSLEALRLLPAIPWDVGLREAWTPGEAGAQTRLCGFLDEVLSEYGVLRDRPDVEGVSRLSPYLHGGEISPRQVMAAVQERTGLEGEALWWHPFCRELGWREFAYHLLTHFPRTTAHPLNAVFKAFPWVRDGEALAAWQQGRTGYPLVDAGMRQLWATGWMHNRVRMVVASFLVKHLLVGWQEGAAWFWDTLVDADLANNTMGWQWSAGCGADAAPFFRIFNPVRQGMRFDPEGAYVRRWVPELGRLEPRWIHAPWMAPPDALKKAGVRLGHVYPLPMVDHDAARVAAMAAYAQLRGHKG